MKAERITVIIPTEITVTAAEYLMMLLRSLEAVAETDRCETETASVSHE